MRLEMDLQKHTIPIKLKIAHCIFIFLSLWIIPLLFRILAKKGSGTGFLGFQLMEPRVPHSNKYMFFCNLKFGKQYLFKNHLRLWFEMCSMFVCFVGSKSWSFTTLLIGCWQKVTQNDGTDICSRHKGPHQERTVNLDKRCRINVTFYPDSCKTQVDVFFFIYLYMMDL